MHKIFSIYRYAPYALAAIFLSTVAACAHQKNSNADPQLVQLQQDPQHPEGWRTQIRDKEFVIFSKVDPPSPDSLHLLQHARIHPGESVLDIGTGTGVLAIFAAENASHVLATDIDPAAVLNARFNIHRYGLENKIELRTGDLLTPIKPEETFNVILINIPYPSKTDPSLWPLHERFFAGIKAHLKANGRIYYQTGYRYNLPGLYAMIKKNGLQVVAEHFAPSILKGAEHITLEIRADN